MKTNTLFLASKSTSRRYLLEQSKINYKIIDQFAPEIDFNPSAPLDIIVKQIALEKMNYIILPKESENQETFFLTADTLCQDPDGNLLGKPNNYSDAVNKIKSLRLKKLLVCTGYCLELKIFKNGNWITKDQIIEAVCASCEIDIPDEYIEIYIQNTSALHAAGALIVENFGMQFVRSISGSYSTIMGLPLYELRQSLSKLNFL